MIPRSQGRRELVFTNRINGNLLKIRLRCDLRPVIVTAPVPGCVLESSAGWGVTLGCHLL